MPQPTHVPSDVWEQAVPVAGVDLDTGDPVDPHRPVGVVVEGITLTRDAPAAETTFGKIPVLAGAAPIRLGRVPQLARRVLRFTSATVGATAVVASTDYQAGQGYGFVIVAGEPPLILFGSDDVWVGTFSNDGTLSFCHEQHNG